MLVMVVCVYTWRELRRGNEIDFVCVYMVVGMYVSDGCMLVMILEHEK